MQKVSEEKRSICWKRYNVGLWYQLIKPRQLGYQKEARVSKSSKSSEVDVLSLFSSFSDELSHVGCIRSAAGISRLLEERGVLQRRCSSN